MNKNSPFLFLTIKDKFIPLPSIARDHSQNRKCQVRLHSMLFHLIQAIIKFELKFHVFKCPQNRNVVYVGMVC